MPDGMLGQGPGPLPLNAPQASPMSIPSPKEGLQAKSKVEIQQALQLLKKNLNPEVFQVHGPEWKAIDSSIRSLSKVIGEEAGKDLSQAGLKLVASSMGPKGLGGMMGGGAPQAGGMQPGMPMPMPLGAG